MGRKIVPSLIPESAFVSTTTLCGPLPVALVLTALDAVHVAEPVPLPPGSAGPHAATLNVAAMNAIFIRCGVLMNHLGQNGDRESRDRPAVTVVSPSGPKKTPPPATCAIADGGPPVRART